MRTLLVLFLLIVLPGQVRAEVTAFSWNGTMTFDPNEPIPGGSLGGLFADIYGPMAFSGQVPISGNIRFDTSLAPSVQNPFWAGYRDAVLEMSITIAGVEITADFSRIVPFASTSTTFGHSFSGTGFCSSVSLCEEFGVTDYPPGWGNTIVIANDTEYRTARDYDGNVDYFTGDGMLIHVGSTDVDADFVPSITTENHGVFAIHGVDIVFASLPNTHFFHDLALPNMRTFIGTTAIEHASFGILVELPGLSEPLGVGSGHIEELIVLP